MSEHALVLAIVHAIPPTSAKYDNWRDGFTAAVDLLPDRFTIDWVNVHPLAMRFQGTTARSERARIAAADVVLVKSNWGWIPDAVTLRATQRLHDRPRTVLAISGSFPPPDGELLRYDAVLYETKWYQPFVATHPYAFHGFGIDTTVMVPGDQRRDIDWLMVGRPAGFKNPTRLADKPGVRWMLGEIEHHDAVVAELRTAGVVVKDFVPYEDLADIYRRSRNVLVAADLHGGGERTVLEGRACGCAVEVPADNPKLVEVAEGPVHDHRYYAQQLLVAIEAATLGSLPGAAKKVAMRKGRRRMVREAARARVADGRRLVRAVARRAQQLIRRPG